MRKTLLATFAVLALVISTAGPATAAKGRKKPKSPPAPVALPTAIVSLGDSYISGEAGRWDGNSPDNGSSRNGTDRAWNGSGYDVGSVYVDGTDSNGCHRSDAADIHSTGIAVDASINLACSGAQTANVRSGGTSQNGYAPQADQLAAVAAGHDVEMVVLSIGGNDLGFADIIISCTVDWFTSPWWWKNTCAGDEQPNVNARMPAAMAGVAASIDDIRTTLSAAGQAPDSYRLVVRSYPSPIPRASENRYPESGWSRWDDGGCPFWNSDANWARDSLVPQISDNLRAVAASKGVEFLDMQDSMQGREVCSTQRSHVTSSPDGSQHEWVRWLNTGYDQGDAQESLHPNAFGQRAAGRCLGLLAGLPAGEYTCTPTAGGAPADMAVSPI